MGAHPKAPSRIEGDGTLLEHVAYDPSTVLGKRSVAAFGRRLPFLVKLLAADTALSIQAHPDLRQAAEGYVREEDAGIDRLAPDRTYRDRGHKPELMYALSDFWALCGFRPVEAAASDFFAAGLTHLWDAAGLAHLWDAAETTERETSDQTLQRTFNAIYSLDEDGRRSAAAKAVAYAAERLAGLGSDDPNTVPGQLARYAWLAYLQQSYPDDIGLLAPLYLNVVHLRPGDALFQPARTLHAYLHGFGVEVMAASDNVVRAGLTIKHVDDRELARILRFESVSPKVYEQATVVAGQAAEFSVWMYNRPAVGTLLIAEDAGDIDHGDKGTGTGTMVIPVNIELGDSAAVVVCTRDGLDVKVPGRTVSARRGDSFFVDAVEGLVTLSGGGSGLVVRTGLRDLDADGPDPSDNPGLKWDDVP